MKAYTDINQSRKLATILPIESADMRYGYIAPYDLPDRRYNGGYDEIPYQKDFLIKNLNFSTNEYDGELPCWSLATLLNILTNNKYIDTTISRGSWRIDPVAYLPNIWWCEYEDRKSLTEFNVSANNPVDACYEMILKLHELNLL